MPFDLFNMDTVDIATISISFEIPPPLPLSLPSSGSRKASRIDLTTPLNASNAFDRESPLVVEESSPKAPSFAGLPFDIHHTIAEFCGPKWAALLAQTSWQMREVVEHAKESGELESPARANVDETLEWCSGSSERLRVAWNQGFPDDRRFAEEAAAVGDVEMLKQARRDGCPFDWRACRAAAAGGHLEALQFLREHGCTWDYRTYEAAVKGGHLGLLGWLSDHGCPSSKGCCKTE